MGRRRAAAALARWQARNMDSAGLRMTGTQSESSVLGGRRLGPAGQPGT
jgi:hypothetical protein